MSRKLALVSLALILLAGLALAATPGISSSRTAPMQGKKPIPEIVIPAAPSLKMSPKSWKLQEGFEGSFLPAGWDTVRLGGTSASFISQVTTGTYPTCTPHGGGYMVKYNSYSASAGNRERLITTPVIINSLTDSLSFWMTHDPGYTTNNDRIVVEIMINSGGGWGAWTAIDSFSRYQATMAWVYHALPLGAYNGDSVRISLTGHSEYGNSMYLDDVAIGCAYTPVAGDLALQSIDAPTAVFTPGSFTPAVTVRNPGSTPVSDFQVIYNIDDGSKALVYSDTALIATPDTLLSGADTSISFDGFTPSPLTAYTVTAFVSLAGDPNPANDTVKFDFRTWDLDVGPTAITAPGTSFGPSADITPQATFHNYGAEAADFDAYFEIYDSVSAVIYAEAVPISGLPPGADTSVFFPLWAAPHDVGNYNLVAFSVLANDLNNGNDTLAVASVCNPWIVVGQEGFEGATWPPDGWDTLNVAGTQGTDPLPIFWNQNTAYVHSGTYAANFGWGYTLDGWLRWKTADLTAYNGYRLSFWWDASYYWSVDPNDNCDLFVKVSPDSGVTWDTLWTFGDQTMVGNSGVVWPWVNWTWYQSTLDLSAYAHLPNVWIGFQLVGNDDAEVGIDDVVLEANTFIGVAGKPTEPAKATFALLPNYPNPARGRTVFSFSLPRAGEYRLKVYNLAGQLVHTIAGNGTAGLNTVNWTPGRTANGVYFYRLNAAGRSATRKLVIIK
jgi:hypothetical protein